MHPDTTGADDTPLCICCRRGLYADEGYTCRPCQDRADQHLATLAGPVTYARDNRNGRKLVSGLYAALAGAMLPGRSSSDGPVSGTRGAPLPIRLEPLSLSARGGVISVLQSWQIDWHERLGWTHPQWQGRPQQQLDQVVRALRNNLPWAASEHPAFDEFARELAATVGQVRAVVTGERAERPLRVLCATPDCPGVLQITLKSDGVRCPRCQTTYSHDQLTRLELAARSMAA